MLIFLTNKATYRKTETGVAELPLAVCEVFAPVQIHCACNSFVGLTHFIVKYKLVKRTICNYNHPFTKNANVAELVDALDLGSSRLSCESSSLSIRTTLFIEQSQPSLCFQFL